MEKYKICPICGTHNNPLFLECFECETDLQNVPVVDKETECVISQGTQSAGESASTGTMVRICDCGAKNPVQARRCSVCGEDISMNIPVPDVVPSVQRYVFSSLDGTYAYEVQSGTTVIGRENEMQEYLASKPYVSRKHAELSLNAEDGKLIIRNCSTTNYTFINNELISSDTGVELKDGDEVGLGGNEQNGSRQAQAAYFMVRIGTCT